MCFDVPLPTCLFSVCALNCLFLSNTASCFHHIFCPSFLLSLLNTPVYFSVFLLFRFIIFLFLCFVFYLYLFCLCITLFPPIPFVCVSHPHILIKDPQKSHPSFLLVNPSFLSSFLLIIVVPAAPNCFITASSISSCLASCLISLLQPVSCHYIPVFVICSECHSSLYTLLSITVLYYHLLFLLVDSEGQCCNLCPLPFLLSPSLALSLFSFSFFFFTLAQVRM